MLEFILHSGMTCRYWEACKKLEAGSSGASTDHQLQFCLPGTLELLGIDDYLPGRSETVRTADATPTFVDFIQGKHTYALQAAYNSLFAGRAPACMPAQMVAGDVTQHGHDFSASLKLLTLNVRSMNDLGKVKFVFHRLQNLGADIAFLQETRLPLQFNIPTMDGFHIVTAPAQAGHGGLLIAVKKSDYVVAHHHRIVSSRVLVASFEIASRKCRLVCLHAPIAEAPICEHETFAVQVAEATENLAAGEILLIGADLNARLRGRHEDYSCVGEQAVSDCPHSAEFRSSCLEVLSSRRVKAANTVLASPSHTTWKHPSGSEHQLDYIFIPEGMIDRGKLLSTAVGAWGHFDCGTTSDHRHIETVIMFQSKRSSSALRRTPKRVQFANDAHLQDYVSAAVRELKPWSAEEPVADYLEKMSSTITELVRRTAPQRAPQRKPWLTPEAWAPRGSAELIFKLRA
eukprot:6327195-Amphidinium_carterae.4